MLLRQLTDEMADLSETKRDEAMAAVSDGTRTPSSILWFLSFMHSLVIIRPCSFSRCTQEYDRVRT